MYGSWDMVRDRCNCYFSFWAFFCPFTSLTPQKIKILKKWKKLLETSSFYICVPKIMIRWCTVPEICCARWTDGGTNRWTDRRTEKVNIEVGAPLKKRVFKKLDEVEPTQTIGHKFKLCWVNWSRSSLKRGYKRQLTLPMMNCFCGMVNRRKALSYF